MSPWMKFGDAGLTFAPSTAHKGKCQYSGNRRTCPIPLGCRARVPRKKGRGGVKAKKFGFDPKTLCGMIRDVEVLGPVLSTTAVNAVNAFQEVDKKAHYSRRQAVQNDKEAKAGTFIVSAKHIPPLNQSDSEEVVIDKELDKLLSAEHELQRLLADVAKLRQKIRRGGQHP